MAAINISTGKVDADCGETQTETDCDRLFERLVRDNPGYRVYHILLNTHESETLVCRIAEWCQIKTVLGF